MTPWFWFIFQGIIDQPSMIYILYLSILGPPCLIYSKLVISGMTSPLYWREHLTTPELNSQFRVTSKPLPASSVKVLVSVTTRTFFKLSDQLSRLTPWRGTNRTSLYTLPKKTKPSTYRRTYSTERCYLKYLCSEYYTRGYFYLEKPPLFVGLRK